MEILINILLNDTRQKQCIIFHEKVAYYLYAPFLLIIIKKFCIMISDHVRSAGLSYEFLQ